MLFILRQLRRLEIRQRSGRYFLYAIGEVVLIVIGILIAVQIGDWNQARKDAFRKDQYLTRLVSDIERDLEGFEHVLSRAEGRRHLADMVIQAINNRSIPEEQPAFFLVALQQCAWTTIPEVNSDTFEQMRSTGHLELFEDDLTTALFEYHRWMNRKRQFDTDRQHIKFRYRELIAQILTTEQQLWLQGEALRIFDDDSLDQIASIPVDQAAVMDTWEAFRNHKDLVDWVPNSRRTQFLFIRDYTESIERANQLLETVKAAQ